MARKTTKRVSSQEIAKLAHANPGSEVELDGAFAYLTIGSVDYIARLETEAASLDPAAQAKTWPGSNRPGNSDDWASHQRGDWGSWATEGNS